MKLLNVILSVLVLIMAGLSAASAYMLFEKRTQMVDGWQKLSTAINQSSTALDKNSGTKIGSELTLEALAHTNYENLDSTLVKLKKQAEDLIAERDAMAKALRRVGSLVDMKNVPSEKALTEVGSSATACNDIVAGVSDIKARRNALAQKLIAVAKSLKVNINAKDLNTGDLHKGATPLLNIVNVIKNKISTYTSRSQQVGNIVGAKGMNFSDKTYAKTLENIVNATKAQKSQISKVTGEKNSINSKLNSANNTIKQRNGQIASLKKTIAGNQTQIAQYRKALGLEPEVEFKPWTAGSAEARRQVAGKVVEVNEKYGFIAIDLGSKTVVYQEIGKKKVAVNPEIKSGMTLQVARNIDTPEVQYIGSIKLVTVEDNCSTAEGVELAPNAKIAVGDSVFFARAEKKTAKR